MAAGSGFRDIGELERRCVMETPNQSNVKKFLLEEAEMKDEQNILMTQPPYVVAALSTDDDSSFLQFWGWGIRLLDDGHWYIEDTSGG